MRRNSRNMARRMLRWVPAGALAALICLSTAGISYATLNRPVTPTAGTALLGAPTSHDSAQLQAKRRMLQAQADSALTTKGSLTRQQAAAQPQPEPAGAATGPKAGISQSQQAPFATSVFAVRNSYQGPVGRQWLQAFAGGPRGPSTGEPSSGALRVYSGSSGQGPLQRIGDFPAPKGFGPLRIDSISGTRLLLTDDTGRRIAFDLGTRHFD
jgi:hypothetical protein